MYLRAVDQRPSSRKLIPLSAVDDPLARFGAGAKMGVLILQFRSGKQAKLSAGFGN